MALRLGHIGDTRQTLDTIIAQKTAKENLDFGKRAQKSAKLSGGVVRLQVFSSTVKGRTAQNAVNVNLNRLKYFIKSRSIQDSEIYERCKSICVDF